MRLLALAPLLFVGVCLAQTPTPAAVQQLFPMTGVQVLCDQTEPLLRRGLPDELSAKLGQRFSRDGLCSDMAQRIANGLTEEQLGQIETLFQSPLVHQLQTAETAVGQADAEAFAQYRQQLEERPPRGARLELIKRLDAVAHTSDLAHLLRYEIGKTQAWLAVHGRGDSVTEVQLHEGTQKESQAIRDSTEQGVTAFMLYAYRQIPSDQLQAYIDVYEQPGVAALYDQVLAALPPLFAERRAQLR